MLLTITQIYRSENWKFLWFYIYNLIYCWPISAGKWRLKSNAGKKKVKLEGHCNSMENYHSKEGVRVDILSSLALCQTRQGGQNLLPHLTAIPLHLLFNNVFFIFLFYFLLLSTASCWKNEGICFIFYFVYSFYSVHPPTPNNVGSFSLQFFLEIYKSYSKKDLK